MKRKKQLGNKIKPVIDFPHELQLETSGEFVKSDLQDFAGQNLVLCN